MHTLTESKGARLKYAREKLGLSQQAVADIIGCRQNGVSMRESDVTNISYEEAQKLEQHPETHIRLEWLLNSRGDMLLPSDKLSEGSVVYESLQMDTTDGAITERFVIEVELEAGHRRLLKGEIAQALHISGSHWSQLKSGEKNVTAPMLAHGVLNLGIDANFVLARKESRRGNDVLQQEEIKKLTEDNENLRIVIQALKQKNNVEEHGKKERA